MRKKLFKWSGKEVKKRFIFFRIQVKNTELLVKRSYAISQSAVDSIKHVNLFKHLNKLLHIKILIISHTQVNNKYKHTDKDHR